jgi:hypothetical protein
MLKRKRQVDPVLHFGKHRGKRISDCPTEYLDLLLGGDSIDPGLKDDIHAHLKTRSDWKSLDLED